MDVVARTMAFIVMAVAVDMQQIKFVEQAVLFKHFQRAVNGDAVDARIDLLGAFENGVGGEMPLGLIHDLEEHAPLAREPDALPLERGAEAAGLGVRINPLTR